jgi:hypothetical protein
MSPFIDDRGRLFGRLNILDIFVVLLVVVLAVFAFTRVRDTNTTTFRLRTTLEVDKVRGEVSPTATSPGEPLTDVNSRPPSVLDKIKVGQTVRDDSGNILGKVETAPKVERTVEEQPTQDGDLRYPPSQIYYDLTITVVGDAQGSKSSPRIGSLPISISSTNFIQVVGPGWSAKMTIGPWEVVKP